MKARLRKGLTQKRLTVKNWFSAGYSKGQRGMTKVAPVTPEGPEAAITEKFQAAWLRGYDAGAKKPVVRKGRQPKAEPEYMI